jgi:hypothetical protein
VNVGGENSEGVCTRQVMVFILLNDYTDKKAYKQTIKIICFKESYEYEMSILQ